MMMMIFLKYPYVCHLCHFCQEKYIDSDYETIVQCAQYPPSNNSSSVKLLPNTHEELQQQNY
jgi:hypothetical protein